jgi:flagellar biosynthesis/type III secretory pathway M-ring protein FliF/YscJ
MMMLMVRKAGKHVAPPKAEELAGSPPTLETKSDVVGEADETETAMTGILVGDEELKATKLKEQVSELIQKSPDTAVKVLNRWVSVEQ